MAITGDPLGPALFGTGGRLLPVAASSTKDVITESPEDEEESEAVMNCLQMALDDENALLSPIALAIITLHHLARLSLEQPFDLSKYTCEDLLASPFCIDVRPVCFSSMMSILHHTIKALSEDGEIGASFSINYCIDSFSLLFRSIALVYNQENLPDSRSELTPSESASHFLSRRVRL